MADNLRSLIERHLTGGGRGSAAELAREAGVSPATVSRIRTGAYSVSDGSDIAERLRTTIEQRDAAEAIASGRYKPEWLIYSRDNGLRLVKTQSTVDRLVEKDPTCHVIQIWLGPEPTDVHFVTGGDGERQRR